MKGTKLGIAARDPARRPGDGVSARGRRRRAAPGRCRPRDDPGAPLPLRLAVVTDPVSAGASAGRFITLEGGEGAGKSTQIARLADWLKARGRDVVDHPRARRLAGRRDDPQAAGRRPGRTLGRHDRGAAAFRRPPRPSAVDGMAGAEARRLGDQRPLRRFDARLSGLRPWARSHACSSGSTRSRSAASGPTSRSSSICRSRPASRAPRRGAAARRATKACRATSTSACATGSSRSPQREPKRCAVIDATEGHRGHRRGDRARRGRAAGSLSDGARQGQRRSGRAREARMALRLAAAVAQRPAGRPRDGGAARCWRPSRAASCITPGC